MSHDDFETGIPSAERERLEVIAARLVAERPLPDPVFRGELRRRLAGAPAVTPGLRLRIAALLGTGVALLGVAALGVNDAGPLAPDPPAARTSSAQVTPRWTTPGSPPATTASGATSAR